MMKIKKALTFSNVTAFIALFVALGGTVYAANKISGKRIRPSSLPGNRIKPKTITARRIKPKTLTGRQFKANSLTATQIRQDTLTQINAAGLANVHYAAATVPLSTTSRTGTTATVGCPPNTYAIGGGATVSNEAQAYINDSSPSALRTGWTATGFSPFSPGNTMTLTAVCVVVAKPGSTTAPEYHPAG